MSSEQLPFFTVNLIDPRDLLFEVRFDIEQISPEDFLKRDVEQYLRFRRVLVDELTKELLKAIREESREKILNYINEFAGREGLLERPAKDFEVVLITKSPSTIRILIRPIVEAKLKKV